MDKKEVPEIYKRITVLNELHDVLIQKALKNHSNHDNEIGKSYL